MSEAEKERAAVVAWLRAYPPVTGLSEMAAWNVAAHIERGTHLYGTKIITIGAAN